MKLNTCLFLLFIVSSFLMSLQAQQSSLWINGYVREAQSEEPLPYAQIQEEATQSGVLANQYGYFVIELPKSQASLLTIRMSGYEPVQVSVSDASTLPLHITLNKEVFELDSVVIRSELTRPRPGVSTLTQDYIQAIPTFLGERDVIKSLQYLPGVQRANDGNSSLYVRGGNGDQNLILLDEAPIYNVNHLFGFFSVFNGDAVQSIEFIKGGFPAHYGGRLSSVVSVTSKEGSRDKWGASGSIGISSSQLTIGGPLLKKKASLLVSARRTYWDALVKPFLSVSQANSKPFFFFHDYNAKFSYDINEKNKLIANAYSSWDRYGTRELFSTGSRSNGLAWQNLSGSVRWNHIFSPKAFLNTSLFLTNYQVQLFSNGKITDGNRVGRQRLSTGSRMADVAAKTDLYLYPNAAHSIRTGLISFQHRFSPNRLRLFRENYNNLESDIDFFDTEIYNNQEFALYAEDQWRISDNLEVEAGVRASAYRTANQWWINPEPRFKIRTSFATYHALEVSLSRMSQYIHQISNSGLALPIDIWIPSTDDILPQRSWQIALGWNQRYEDAGFSILTEVYAKSMENLVGYREAASFFDLDLDNLDVSSLDWESLITQGDGIAYGAELLLNYQRRKDQLMVSYAWSKTLYQFDDLNNGEAFAPRFDRRHTLSLLYQRDVTKRIVLNAGWFFSTGNPIPIPVSQVYLAGDREIDGGPDDPASYYQYSQLDAYRTRLYHRLDVSIKWKAKEKKRRWNWNYYWEIGAYNAYNRLNPTFFNLEPVFNQGTNTQILRIQQNSLFFITPSLSFHFSF